MAGGAKLNSPLTAAERNGAGCPPDARASPFNYRDLRVASSAG
jgi:hypothetical protein